MGAPHLIDGVPVRPAILVRLRWFCWGACPSPFLSVSVVVHSCAGVGIMGVWDQL